MVWSLESYIFSAVAILLEAAFGLPPLRPLALAASRPCLVRCRVRSLSNWDSPAKIVSSRFPCGVVVSSHVSLSDFIEAPASCILSMIESNSLTERPSRVSSVIITVSPERSESIILSSCGRSFFTPDIFSLYIRSHSDWVSRSVCPSRFCPVVDTLA